MPNPKRQHIFRIIAPGEASMVVGCVCANRIRGRSGMTKEIATLLILGFLWRLHLASPMAWRGAPAWVEIELGPNVAAGLPLGGTL